MLSDWDSSVETTTTSGALTPPTGLASTWCNFMPPTTSHSNVLEHDLSQTPLSSDILSMDPVLLESIAFSLEQFPPEPNSMTLGFSMDGFTTNTIDSNTLHVPSAVPMRVSDNQRSLNVNNELLSSLETGTYYSPLPSNTNQLLGVRGPQQFTPSPDYATAFGLPEPEYLKPGSQSKAPTEVSTRSVSPSSQDSDGGRLQEKRRRNKLAARRLRQKKMDQMSDLESKLEEMTRERDELRLKAAKWEGEVMVLRQLLGKESGK
ncbi:uncharacterized protein N7496_010061 [Penicillium cataractarum]|uniref:BZIP domain-containing protein n=1 Tax=Penicillium cataractarum TaxID=2100454 RepID=A0A9W9RUZ9_9EURO|nr:uncharacterized protein N7496_010061 [Penicillium cataractarum]KAJ5364348.1 hypothetical protein N7496_010061 [Penicillium cataractarum]